MDLQRGSRRERGVRPLAEAPRLRLPLKLRLPITLRLLLAALLSATGALGLTAATAAAAAAAPQTSDASASCPWVGSSLPTSQLVAEVMSQMTVAQEQTLVEGDGAGFGKSPYFDYMPGIPSLCIPPLGLTDGDAGVADAAADTDAMPAPIALAATWSTSLADQFGSTVGAELAAKGASGDLGPMVNIDRDPRFGRTFETFSEDPFLTAAIGDAEITGVQSQGVMATVKHMAAYNQETNRTSSADDVIVDPRVLREIYLPAFQAAVEHAGVASAMCAYTTINGTQACSNTDLLTSTLRGDWDFHGFVSSDFEAITSDAAAPAGTDMEQPEPTYYGAPLAADIASGKIPESVLNTMVQRILTEMFRFNLINHPLTTSTWSAWKTKVATPAHRAVAEDVAESSMTLLQNNDHALPLAATNGGSIAVIGPAASAQAIYGGQGSPWVGPQNAVTPLAGLQAAAGSGTTVSYTQGLPTDTSLASVPWPELRPWYFWTPRGGSYTGTLVAPQTGTYVLGVRNVCECFQPTYLSLNGQQIVAAPGTFPFAVDTAAVDLVAGTHYMVNLEGASQGILWATPSSLAPSIAAAVTAAKSASAAVVVVGDDTESEAADRPSLNLPSAQDELIEAVAAANPRTIVVVEAGAPVVMPWLSKVAAVLDAWYPGEVNGTALANVLFGNTDPGGHLPITFPTSLSQIPTDTLAQFPGTSGQVDYSEGLDVGYRYYDADNVTPLFPFGYGLSYTSFGYSNLNVTPSSTDGTGDVAVTATVTNTGSVAGSDVAQAYLGDPAAAGEPPRQLVGFERVTLNPGQSTQVSFTVTPRDTWWWNDSTSGWSQSSGTYDVYVGDSSALANLPLTGSFPITTSMGSRSVSVAAPATMAPGVAANVTVTLGAGGDQALGSAALALQLPTGWTATASGPASFTGVGTGTAETATFSVTPPSYAPNTSVTIHATATLGASAQLEAGATTTVS